MSDFGRALDAMGDLMERAGKVGGTIKDVLAPMDDFSQAVALLTALCNVAQENGRPKEDVLSLFEDLWQATIEARATKQRGAQ